MISREDIVKEARSWVGTSFSHQGRLKKTKSHNGGCDCIGLIAGVAKELKISCKESLQNKYLYQCDEVEYARIPDGKMLQQKLSYYLNEITKEQMRSGDIGLFRFEGSPQHVGIITDYMHGGLGMIHSYAPARKVVEHSLDKLWMDRFVAAYSFEGVSD